MRRETRCVERKDAKRENRCQEIRDGRETRCVERLDA